MRGLSDPLVYRLPSPARLPRLPQPAPLSKRGKYAVQGTNPGAIKLADDVSAEV